MLAWDSLGREKFEQLVEALALRDATRRGKVARAVDGRGGDGGIDIEVRSATTSQLLEILQLKYFREGFSGGFRANRRRQIADSFAAAMKHRPREWVLVVPRNPTGDEWAFLQGLGRAAEGGAVPVKCWGPAELDAMLAYHPELEEYAERQPLRTALEIVGRPSAAVATTDDLFQETSRLAGKAMAWSPYWAPRVSHSNGQATIGFDALREDSAEREPLTFTFQFEWEQHPELLDDFTHALSFGLTRHLELPSEVVRGIRRQGPDWFIGEGGPGVLTLGPMRTIGIRGRVSCVGADGRTLASRQGVMHHVGQGSRGGLLEIKVLEGLTLSVQIAFGTSDGRVEFLSNITGLSGTAVRQHFQFVKALEGAVELRLMFDELDVSFGLSGEPFKPDPVVVEFADDAAAIEELAGFVFSWPEDYRITAEDRQWVRAVRHMLEGKTILVPGGGALQIEVEQLSPIIEKLLTEGSEVYFSPQEWKQEMLGDTLAIEGVRAMHPGLVAEDGATHLSALRRNPGKPHSIRLVPMNAHSGFHLWIPERSGSGDPSEPVPWELDGIGEHPQLSPQVEA